MAESELKVLCVKAVQRIHKIPFSDWGQTDLLAEVLFEEFAPALRELATATLPSNPSAGREGRGR